MNKDLFEEFGIRAPHIGARLYDESICNTTVFDAGYKIVIPKAKGASPYLSLEKSNSQMHIEDFMVCIGTVTCGSSSTKLYESDVVDFSYKDYRGLGAVVYVPEKYMYALKDTKTKALYPLKDARLNMVIGNIYSCESLFGLDIDKAYDKMHKKMPAAAADSPHAADLGGNKMSVGDKTAGTEAAPSFAASNAAAPKEDSLDIYINVYSKDNSTNWTYTLLRGSHIKTDEGAFKKQGDAGYYGAAAGIIALNKVTVPRPIRIFTPDKTIAFLFQENRLENWAKNGWKKENGQALKNQPLLAELYENISRVGGNISAQICAPDFRLAV